MEITRDHRTTIFWKSSELSTSKRVRSDITSRASDAMNFCATVGQAATNKIDLG